MDIDHLVLPSKIKNEAAKVIAEIFGCEWMPSTPILDPENKKVSGYDQYRSERASVYINASFTLDFMDAGESIPRIHVCFRISDGEFDAVVARMRAKGIAFRSEAEGPIDNQVNLGFGGKRLYWNDPDNHNWEVLTKSYARRSELPKLA